MSRMTWRERRHCPHAKLRGIYGDEINHRNGRRLQCMDCGRYLDGPVAYADMANGYHKAAREALLDAADAWDEHPNARIREQVQHWLRARANAYYGSDA